VKPFLGIDLTDKKKNKTQIALNRLFNFLIIVGTLLGWISFELFIHFELGWGIGFGAAALLCVAGALIFTPYCYLFDPQGISLCYVFLPTERYLWKKIHAIEVIWIHHGKPSFLDFLYASVFSIHGKNEGKPRFYMEGHIRKSFRTKRLLEKYWDGTITGYFFEKIKNSIKKHRDKKQKLIKAHSADEIKKIERETRAKVRDWLSFFIAEANQHSLSLTSEYLYITNDFEEYRSRPKAGYTYTLLIEIARPNETDEDRIIIMTFDLIYVRLGKIAYKGVLNEDAEEELKNTLRKNLDEIYQKGIEAYCQDI